jgi:citrate synthase
VADNPTSDEVATLQYPGGELQLDIEHATEGADGIALDALLTKSGYTTFDPGFVNTSSTKSAITYIDGENGILRYRGYPIEQLAEKSTFIEVSYLLIYGELPTKEQLDRFTTLIQRHTLLHEDLKRFFDGFPRNAHPMPVLSSAVNALSAYYQDSLDPMDNEQVELSTIRLLAKLLQEICRPAVPLSGQLADVGGELPADDVRVPGRALQGGSGDRPGAGHAADPSRRP